MPRPPKKRRICCYPDYWSFSPDSDKENDTILLSLDEFETIRLIDYCQNTQEECAREMQVARTTVTAIYDTARQKLAQALVEGRRILISGGNYTLDSRIPAELTQKGTYIMRIAVTYENGEIFQHFGHTEQFKLYDIVENKIISSQIIDTNGSGHGALAGFLKMAQADILICGGIGGGAQMALKEAGIQLFAGNSGNADDTVQAFLNGTLAQNQNPTCNHHHGSHEGHSCGNHSCGEH